MSAVPTPSCVSEPGPRASTGEHHRRARQRRADRDHPLYPPSPAACARSRWPRARTRTTWRWRTASRSSRPSPGRTPRATPGAEPGTH
ncbi:hypothetical protein QJS66_13165 [Kocuria rhizophila]|nr:hypothetical protein QJS66_13165 [Kocuria rhizophila]